EVRFRAQTGKHLLVLSFTGYDPGCVKTHTSWRCRKCNSQGSDRAASAQHDLALITRNHFAIFYAPSKRACFYTAKTQGGHWTASRAADGPVLSWAAAHFANFVIGVTS